MRISRSVQLHASEGVVHTYWRCHDKQFYLNQPGQKDLYRECTIEGLKKQTTQENVFIHAYCAMDNHYHQVNSYRMGSYWLSRYFRQAHGLFGARYNRQHSRSGKVAESRPKTALIGDLSHEMRVQFYIEANPLRAGMYEFENLHLYKHSSFRYYAYGIKDQYTRHLTEPEWYKELGDTAQIRQKRYRALFREYLETYGTRKMNFLKLYVGDGIWVLRQTQRCKGQVKERLLTLKQSVNSS